jgi:hypothetical protein
MSKSRNRQTKVYEEDEWGDKRDKQRKRYDKVKVAIKKARKNKRKQRESTFYGD